MHYTIFILPFYVIIPADVKSIVILQNYESATYKFPPLQRKTILKFILQAAL